jgi:hypothetical protein
MAPPNSSGRASDWVMTGATIYMATVVVVNLKVAMRTR